MFLDVSKYCISFFINIFYLCVYVPLLFACLRRFSLCYQVHRKWSARNLNSTSVETSWHIAEVRSDRHRTVLGKFVSVREFGLDGHYHAFYCVRGQNTYIYILFCAQNIEQRMTKVYLEFVCDLMSESFLDMITEGVMLLYFFFQKYKTTTG